MTFSARKFGPKLAVVALAAALSACAGMGGTGASALAKHPKAASPSYAADSLSGAYLAGNFAAAEGDLDAAQEFYTGTLRTDPDNDDLLARAFLFAATAGDMTRANDLAARLVEKQPDNRGARLLRAAVALHDKDYDRANDEVTKGSAGPFTSLTNAALIAWIRAGKGDTAGSLQALQFLATQQGVQGLYLFHKALLLDYADSKDTDQAYQEAITALGTSARLVEAYGDYLERHGRAADARKLYQQAEADNPDQPFAPMALKRLDSGHTPEKLVSTPAQGAAEALFGIAASLNERRSDDVSMFYLNLALYLRPDMDIARVLLADRLEKEEDYAGANAQYAQVGASSPYRQLIDVQSALNTARLGDNDKAIAALRALASSRPNDPQIWAALGDLERDANKYPEAVGDYTKAIAIGGGDPSSQWNLYYARAVAYEESNKWDDAERDLQQALKLSPEQPEVLNYLGYSWVDRGQNLNEAMKMLERAHALRPLDGYIADSVGWAYFRLQRYKDATQTLEEAVLLTPGNSTVNDHLGDAYWRVGRKIEARFQWRHALSLDPAPGDRDSIAKKLQLGLDAVDGSKSAPAANPKS